MRIIQPFGKRILISPIATEYKKTEGGIDVDTDLNEGIVVEVSADVKHLFNQDDHVLYTKGSGQSEYYKSKACLWLNDFDIWGIVTYDEIKNL